MFIGHYAPAFVAATSKRSPGLGTLFVAAQLVDIGFFSFVLAGAEHMRIVPGITRMNPMDLYDMPWTHSLAGSAGWAVLFALIVWAWKRDLTAAALAGAVVLSHWLLDLLVHRPDLTLAGSPPKFGLGLWNFPAIEMPLELLLAFGALGYYAVRTRARGATGTLSLAILAIILATVQAIDWFGPEPERLTPAIPITALVAYAVLAVLAGWNERKRDLR
ncbi:hypothetical protein [Stakelama marina]|uniref:Metal-dependent hydrolase n=1 Tax=Stakelama marina TaxID=2826939 RepID=A0A8T4IE87_9SPHN|nr:hypothetical protein [Stakelama marina]MBR0552164.1 hypothetical protein [Stakelama marina]